MGLAAVIFCFTIDAADVDINKFAYRPSLLYRLVCQFAEGGKGTLLQFTHATNSIFISFINISNSFPNKPQAFCNPPLTANSV